MRLAVRIARALPAFRRLQDRLDQLASDKDKLSADLRALLSEREKLISNGKLVDDLKYTLDRQQAAQADGRLVEFEYPYNPHYRDWDSLPKGNPYKKMLAEHEASYRAVLESFLPLTSYLSKLSNHETDDTAPYWDNGWLPVFDGISIYGMVTTRNPRYYFEVGSGNSTKFARRAIQDHALRTKIISVDPQPRAIIDKLCDETIRCGLEDIDLSRFADLGREDVLFVDNSHRSFQGSDVTVFFTEVLPTLGEGCVYGLHDILVPGDYPKVWYHRFYNEQYLLMAYLLGGAGGDEIVLPSAYVSQTPALARILDPIAAEPAGKGAPTGGSIFWMRRSL